MKTIRALVFSSSILLAVGALAQNPAGGQSMPQSQAPQGGMQQSQPQPSQNPGAIQPGQTQQQPGAEQQSAPPQGQAPTIDDQVKVLAQQLNLNSDQQAKVKAALEDQHSQAMAIIHDDSLPRQDKIQKIHALRESTIAKVRTTLTNDDQKKKFDQMVQTQDERSHVHDQQAPPQPK
jgi:hypothetical protein